MFYKNCFYLTQSSSFKSLQLLCTQLSLLHIINTVIPTTRKNIILNKFVQYHACEYLI